MRATPIAAALAVLALSLPAAPARQYAVNDDSSEASPAEPARPDYSRYFAPAAAVSPGLAALAPVDGQQQQQDDSAGFVRPLDFSALFAAAPVASQLHPQVLGVGQGLSSPGANIFGLQDATGAASNSNGTTGFTAEQVRFPSLFDAAGSASEAGFRPQDFLPAPGGGAQQPLSAAAPPQDSFSPSLSKLQRDYSLRPTHYDAAIRAAAAAASAPAAAPAAAPAGASAPRPQALLLEERPKPYTGYRAAPAAAAPAASASASAPAASGAASGVGLRAAAVELLPGAPLALAQARPRPYVGYRAAPEVEGVVAAAPSGNHYRNAQATKREQPQYYSGSSYEEARAPAGDPAEYERLASYQASIVPYQKPPKAEAEASEPRPGKSSYPGTPTAGFSGKYLKPEKPDAGRYHDDAYESAVAASDKAVGGYTGSNYKERAYDEVAAIAKEGKASVSSGAGKKCKKVEKKVTADDVASGRFRRQAMTCFVCEDPATGGNYEECSYGSEPKQEAYFVGSARSFKAKPTETSVRYRRDLDPELAAMETESRVYRQAPSDYERELDAFLKSDTSSHYKFGPSSSSSGGYGPSERLTAAAAAANCQKVVKDSMTCQVCKDPKTGGSYEQCSYSTKPQANNYFVEQQSSYSSGSKQPPRSTSSKYDSRVAGSERRDAKLQLPSKDSATAASGEQASSGLNLPEVKGLDPFLYGEADAYDPQAASDTSSRYHTDYYAPYKSYEEYFRHLFPDLGAAGSAAQPSARHASGDYSKSGSRPEFYSSAPSERAAASLAVAASASAPADKKDLDAVLGEFTRKDRSACKKVERDRMTCYQCADASGTQHEECMFVAASQPKKQHLAYHEHKQFKLPPLPGVPVAAAGKDSSGAASAVDQQTDSGRSNDTTAASPTSETPTTTTAAKSKRKTFFKKASAAAAAVKPTVAAAPTARKVRITRRSSKSSLTTLTTTRQTLTAPRALADDVEAAGSERREAVAEAEEAGEAGAEDRREGAAPSPNKAEPAPPELSEADRSPDGLYSSETRLVFDPVLKVTLPRYMLTRSEHEDVFDEVMASGR